MNFLYWAVGEFARIPRVEGILANPTTQKTKLGLGCSGIRQNSSCGGNSGESHYP
jgi:hypothetical protein